MNEIPLRMGQCPKCGGYHGLSHEEYEQRLVEAVAKQAAKIAPLISKAPTSYSSQEGE